MTATRVITAFFSVLLTFLTVSAQDIIVSDSNFLNAVNISSTAVGGPWSSPSTWAGGVVPSAADNVTIINGATVVIDINAAAGNLTIGGAAGLFERKAPTAEGGTPAVLRFGENGAFSLTVSNDIVIGSNDSLMTGGGNANQHVLSVGGDITNNGMLDLSTNSGLAGATLRFTGPDNAVLGGTGPVTDVFLVKIDKAPGAVIELSPANFTAGGSTVNNPLSAYLTIVSGTLKISGTFSGAHQTFPNGTYTIPVDGGLWLDNPNYTITGHTGGTGVLFGDLRISAGVYNVGNAVNDAFYLREGSDLTVEGGNLNVAGYFVEASESTTVPVTFGMSGGAVTACTKGSTSLVGCFHYGASANPAVTANVSGGKIVIQNGSTSELASDFTCRNCMTTDDPVVQFGNASSVTPATFQIGPGARNVVLDTTGAPHTLWLNAAVTVKTMEIGIGGNLETRNQLLTIESALVNNGIIRSFLSPSALIFNGENTSYSGSGTSGSIVRRIEISGTTFTNSATSKLRVGAIVLNSGNIVGANNFTLISGFSGSGLIQFGTFAGDSNPGTFDVAPEFDLGNESESLVYVGGPRTIGPELVPTRHLIKFTFYGRSQEDTLTIPGGELVVRDLDLNQGRVLAPGGIHHYGEAASGNGYIAGTIIRRLRAQESYVFQLGINQRSPVLMNLTSVGGNPTYVAVGTSTGPLPGLHPSTSVNRNWTVSVNGTATGTLRFYWDNADVRGNLANYKLWRSSGGPVQSMPFSLDTPSNSISFGPSSDLAGRWGVGEQLQLAPVSVSGTVRTAGGMPIRNALIRITGPGLSAPYIEGFTGNLGTYLINGLQVGETYTVQVGAKRYRFTPSSQSVMPSGNASGIDFTANPQE